LFQDKMSSIQL